MVDPISLAAGLGAIMSGVGGAVSSGIGALGTAGGLGTAAAVAGAGAGIYGAVEAGQAAKKAGGVTVNTPSAPPAALAFVFDEVDEALPPCAACNCAIASS